jgi:hypothetical protein
VAVADADDEKVFLAGRAIDRMVPGSVGQPRRQTQSHSNVKAANSKPSNTAKRRLRFFRCKIHRAIGHGGIETRRRQSVHPAGRRESGKAGMAVILDGASFLKMR